LKIRILSPRSTKQTTRSRCRAECPTMISRASVPAWSGSSKMRAETVAEDGQRFFERYTVLLAVGGSLPRLPLEAHVHRMARNLS